MPKVFTTVPGQEVQIGNHGVATNDRPCTVPESVAEELRGPAFSDLRVVSDEPAPKARSREAVSTARDVAKDAPKGEGAES